ncbi:MAG TPA: hypothetical protein VG714_10980 [Acidobacteriaceae bacterium]|nr:hypothetical protein [Acidobacteriaceae bacterium]
MRKLFVLCCAVFALAFTPFAAHAATDVSGTWVANMQIPGGGDGFQLTFTFKQDADKITGTVQSAQGEPLPISNGKIDGDKISFNVSFNGNTITHEGTVSGDEIKLSTKSADGSFPANDLTLKRSKPAAATAP